MTLIRRFPRMDSSLELLGQLLAEETLEETPVVAVFNKQDMFSSKILSKQKQLKLHKYFPDYKGAGCERLVLSLPTLQNAFGDSPAMFRCLQLIHSRRG